MVVISYVGDPQLLLQSSNPLEASVTEIIQDSDKETKRGADIELDRKRLSQHLDDASGLTESFWFIYKSFINRINEFIEIVPFPLTLILELTKVIFEISINTGLRISSFIGWLMFLIGVPVGNSIISSAEQSVFGIDIDLDFLKDLGVTIKGWLTLNTEGIFLLGIISSILFGVILGILVLNIAPTLIPVFGTIAQFVIESGQQILDAVLGGIV